MTEAVDGLGQYLSRVLGQVAQVDSVERVEGGWSRETSRAAIRLADGTRCVLALRREVPVSVLDIPLAREHAVLTSLASSGVPLPAVLTFEPSGRILGEPFLVTSWVDGDCVNVWRRDALDVLGPVEHRRSLGDAWLDDIVCLHNAPVAPLQGLGVDVGLDASAYVRRELDHWTGVVRGSLRHPGPLVDELCSWLETDVPDESAAPSIVHGDLRLGNMIVAGGRIAAFLDWEMSGVGDWRADIGYAVMPYNAGKLLAPVRPSVGLLMHPRAFVDAYAERSGRQMSDDELVWFIVLGCLKMIAIFCTGIDAVVSGRTFDPRLAWTSIALPGIVDDACRLVDGGLPW